jgi:hypothetical protein
MTKTKEPMVAIAFLIEDVLQIIRFSRHLQTIVYLQGQNSHRYTRIFFKNSDYSFASLISIQ